MTKSAQTEISVGGAVGQEFLQILSERNFPIKSLKLFASEKSSGSTVSFQNQNAKINAKIGMKMVVKVEQLTPGCFEGVDVAFFSAGSDISKEWAPLAVNEKCFVIDNSSAFRMQKDVPLIVPEVNSEKIPKRNNPSIIANPNCSTIQLVVALKPLSDRFGLSQVIVSTYQSVSGAGKAAIEELTRHTAALLSSGNTQQLDARGSESSDHKSAQHKSSALKSEIFAHSIAFNNLPHIDVFDDSGFTFEELKIINETQKIMSLPDLDISATAVRTSTFNGHSEAVWADINTEVSRDEFVACLKAAPGIEIMDKPSENIYPLNRDLSGRDEVFIGRIRRDLKNKKRWLMWIVSDNIRKGAALNGIQIAEHLFSLK
jgi:aspartate-semialdehyde dehydrogenase